MFCRCCDKEVYHCLECEAYHHDPLLEICDAGDMLSEEDVTEVSMVPVSD